MKEDQLVQMQHYCWISLATLPLSLPGSATRSLSSQILNESVKLVELDAAGADEDEFGTSVSISGSTVLVGARAEDHAGGLDAGAAYVFVGDDCIWTKEARLVPSDPELNARFGFSVSISGDLAVIGAPNHGFSTGAAYVFLRSGTSWTQEAKLTASDGAMGQWFGYSVSISGDTILVGAPFGTGAAYVFVRTGTTWTEQAKLVAGASAFFGLSVSVSEDLAVVGAPQTSAAAGAAYVFDRSGSIWTEQAKLVAADAEAGDWFGLSVTGSGGTIAVGAPLDHHAGLLDAGSVYVFAQSGASWTEEARLVAGDATSLDNFGSSVSLSGQALLVGAWRAGNPSTGAAYKFERGGSTWPELAKLLASDGADGDNFGTAVALSEDLAVVGAAWDDHAGSDEDAGSVYLFTGCRGHNDLPLTNGPEVVRLYSDPSVGAPVGGTPDTSGDLYWKVYPKEVLRACPPVLELSGWEVELFDTDWSTPPDWYDFMITTGIDSAFGSGFNPGNIEPDFSDPNAVLVSMGNSGFPDPCVIDPALCGFGPCPSGYLVGYEVSVEIGSCIGDGVLLAADGLTDHVVTCFVPGGMSMAGGMCGLGDYSVQDALSTDETQFDWLGTGYSAYGGYQYAFLPPIADAVNESSKFTLQFCKPMISATVDAATGVGVEIGLGGLHLDVSSGTTRFGYTIYDMAGIGDVAFATSTGFSALLPCPGIALLGGNIQLNVTDPFFIPAMRTGNVADVSSEPSSNPNLSLPEGVLREGIYQTPNLIPLPAFMPPSFYVQGVILDLSTFTLRETQATQIRFY